GQVGREVEPGHRRVPVGPLHAALLDGARQEMADPGRRALAELGAHLAADDLDAALDADLGDPGAHRPEPDDADLADLTRHGPILPQVPAPPRTAPRSGGCTSGATGSAGRPPPPRP